MCQKILRTAANIDRQASHLIIRLVFGFASDPVFFKPSTNSETAMLSEYGQLSLKGTSGVGQLTRR